MQKTHSVIYFQLRDVAQYLILWQMEQMNIWFCDRWNKWNIPESDLMYDKINVETFPVLSSKYFVIFC